MPNELQEFHTGLFLEQKKCGVLLDIVQELLRNRYHLVAFPGSQLPDHTCEVLLRPLSTHLSGLNVANAQVLLTKYLSMIKETRPKMFKVVKDPELIDLIESDDEQMDEASVVIVDLDESDIPVKRSEDKSSPNIIKPNSPYKTPTSSINADDVLKHSQDSEEKNNPIILDSDVILVDSEENPILTPKSPPSNINAGDVLKDLAKSLSWKQGKKRKKDLHKEFDKSGEVVEILDDDIIVLDDSFTSPNVSRDHINLSESTVSVVEPSKIPDAAIHILSQSESNFSSVFTTSIDVEEARNSPSLLPLPDTSESTSVNHNVTETSENERENSYLDNSGPPKKKSKLAYHRPAHLNTPLTQPTSAVPSTKIDSVSNIYNPNAETAEKRTGLRPIVIDGNNVAIGHGKGSFSLKGIQICINYFEKRGHRQIKVFIPQYRRNRDTYDELQKMERKGLVVITPSRRVNGKIVASYDDRYIVQYAAEFGGVIVSTDNFRDLLSENPSWRETIENRLLMFTWVDDLLMFPQDPLGRRGPSLDDFLKFPDT